MNPSGLFLLPYINLIYMLLGVIGIAYIYMTKVKKEIGTEVYRHADRGKPTFWKLIVPSCLLESVYRSAGYVFWTIVAILSWINYSFIQKARAGDLLIRTQRSTENQVWMWSGILLGIFAVIDLATWLLFLLVDYEHPKLDLAARFYTDILVVMLSICQITVGLAGFELRENGICAMLIFIEWRDVKSYLWEPSKPTTLTIFHKPLFPYVSPGFMNIAIPASQKEMVNHILNTKLSMQ